MGYFIDYLLPRNGTWCCGGGGQQDVPTDVPPPPPPPSTTTKTTTPTTKPPSTTPPRPHVEDCPCGENIEGMEMAMEKWAKATKNESAIENRVLSQDPEFTPYLVRPWVVRIVVTKDSGEKIECSGSILNKFVTNYISFQENKMNFILGGTLSLQLTAFAAT